MTLDNPTILEKIVTTRISSLGKELKKEMKEKKGRNSKNVVKKLMKGE